MDAPHGTSAYTRRTRPTCENTFWSSRRTRQSCPSRSCQVRGVSRRSLDVSAALCSYYMQLPLRTIDAQIGPQHSLTACNP